MTATVTCARQGCSGTIQDGYCDVCGMAPAAGAAGASGGPAAPAAGAAAGAAAGTGATGATRGTAGRAFGTGLSARTLSGRTATGRSSPRSSRRGRLGAGLVEVPPVPYRDPAGAVLTDPRVPESKRFCSRCGEPVGRGRDGAPGRTEGFCRQCGAAFSFSPKLVAGDVVAGQYEVLGCLAHGGLGWIYLARDHNVSDRWVVLKGLLDTGDADAMAAAVAERRFLAEVEHPNIVRIYNFVQHPDPRTGSVVGYIVMEYVGGQSLKEIALARRREGGSLPLPQVIAYALEVLPALGYLHGRGLLFCDLKPDNVIQTEEQVRLIDLGAVRRADDVDSPVYGTVGYQAPEIATAGPSVSSDLYTVARTMAVLAFDFRGFTSTYVDRLPDPSEVPLLAEAESFHRLLLRATDPDPARRFHSAEEMAEQLTGVLREVLSAQDGDPRPGASPVFTPERRVFGLAADGSAAEVPPGPAEVASALPMSLVDGADPAAGLLATAVAAEPGELVTMLKGAPESTPEVRLRLALAHADLGDPDAAGAVLDALEEEVPGDWRVAWYRGVAALAGNRLDDAWSRFDEVYGMLPGEAAPKLALAACAELRGDAETAARYYDVVWRTDRASISAALGLARVLLAAGRRADALAVYESVPDTSSHHVTAQTAAVRAIVGVRSVGDLTDAVLADAGARLERLTLAAERRERLAAEVLDAALAWVLAGRPGDGRVAGEVLGCPLTERGLRRGLERGYRALARRADDRAERVALVDLANAVRPRTLF